MIKTEDIRNMHVAEIDTKIEALKKEHFTLRVQAKTGKLEKQHRIRALKKDIARLLTVKTELLNKTNA
jgi:large subunit ribosomal protein L29